MQLIQKHKLLAQIIILTFSVILISSACDNSAEEFEKKGPKKRETRRVIVDVNVISTDNNTRFEALFYYDIAGMIDGKEVAGVDKEVIKVKKAKLGDLELKETKDTKDRTIYTAEIPKEKKEYELTFSPNENLESLHKLSIDPISIKQEDIKLEKNKTQELELTRTVTGGELPAIIEITNPQGKFVPAAIEYLSGNLFFKESALAPFAKGNNTIRVRFETIPTQRDQNKSVRYLNYAIDRKIEIVE